MELDLDNAQLKIVKSQKSRIIVIAGAGSGKTRVLTERVKRLLKEGIDACNIVVITFTNMAADEMRERLVNVEGIGDAFIGTIHSFANKLMQNSDESYEIYTDEKENAFASFIIRRYCKHLTYDRFLGNKDMKYKMDMGIIAEDDYNSFLLPSEKSDLTAMFKENPNGIFKHTIQSMCKSENVITFDELLKKSTNYFKSLNAQVEHVLVDELQDIGYLEFNFIKALNAKNYFLVGDDWQAIYGFKGGDVNIFLNLIKNKDWKAYYLTTNYRSCKEIIKKAELVINQIDEDKLIKKKVIASRTDTGNVAIISKFKLQKCLNVIKENKYYAMVKGLNENYKDWFILVRTNKQIHELMQVLQSENIPFSCFRKGEMTLEEMREELNKDTVKLLTVHTSKGLESKNVILYGDFPIRQPSYLKNIDERKVMYVGMTRAKDKLIILN
jgi:DNA helicase II / ATP-dependent DNA helicase PcrA